MASPGSMELLPELQLSSDRVSLNPSWTQGLFSCPLDLVQEDVKAQGFLHWTQMREGVYVYGGS